MGLLVIVVIGAIFWLQQFFQVSQVACVLDGRSCPENLTTYTTNFHGLPIFGYDYTTVLETTPFPLPILLTQVKKELPNKLHLEFSMQPLAYQLTTPERKLTISEAGRVFEESNLAAPIEVAVIPPLEQILASETQVQTNVHDCIKNLAKALTVHNLLQSKVSWVDKDTITLIMNGEQQTAILDCTNPAVAVRKLAVIVSSPEYQEKKATIKEIDVRFDLPVLRIQQ